MALQTSGAISLDDIHVEAGGSTGTTASLNDTDIRGLTAASGKTINSTQGTTIDFDDFYGATSQTHVAASGGSTTTSGNYKFHYFTSSGTLSFSSIGSGGPSNTVDYIVIAGGGAGCRGKGGGGGAGGYKTGTFSASVGDKAITIGGGGSGSSITNGSDSSIAGVHTSTGGGRGGGINADNTTTNAGPQSGGSGGGGSDNASDDQQGASGISGEGNAGGDGRYGYYAPYFGTGGGGGG